MKDLSEYEIQVLEIDESIRPIATRPVDTNDPNWMTLLRQREPLDEAGVRSNTETLLGTLVNEYQESDADTRKAIRGLFVNYKYFAWAATLPILPTTEEGFRTHMILFSMRDQGYDSRDAILTLQEFCERARAASVSIGPILRKVAELSSDENKYGMGSTRHLFNTAAC